MLMPSLQDGYQKPEFINIVLTWEWISPHEAVLSVVSDWMENALELSADENTKPSKMETLTKKSLRGGGQGTTYSKLRISMVLKM